MLDRWVDSRPPGYKAKLRLWIHSDDDVRITLSTKHATERHRFIEDRQSTSYEIGIYRTGVVTEQTRLFNMVQLGVTVIGNRTTLWRRNATDFTMVKNIDTPRLIPPREPVETVISITDSMSSNSNIRRID